MKWQDQLDDLFEIYVHQNSIEDAAEKLVSYSIDDELLHCCFLNVLETAILNCESGKDDAMKAINRGTGYNPISVEETLRLLTDIHQQYLREYNMQAK